MLWICWWWLIIVNECTYNLDLSNNFENVGVGYNFERIIILFLSIFGDFLAKTSVLRIIPPKFELLGTSPPKFELSGISRQNLNFQELPAKI